MEFELIDTGLFDDDRYFDVEVEYAKADAGRHAHADHRPQPRTRAGRRSISCRKPGSATSGAGRPGAAKPSLKDQGDGSVLAQHHELGLFASSSKPRIACCSATTTRISPVCSASPAHEATSRTRSTISSCTAARSRQSASAKAPKSPGFIRANGTLRRRDHRAVRLRVGEPRARRASPTSIRSSPNASARRMRSMPPSRRTSPTRTCGSFSARPSPACCGTSSSTISTFGSGWTATRFSRRRRRTASAGATPIGDHFLAADIISMPDKWEYPWFAAWDLAFHCVTLSLIDPDFAKEQLLLLCEVLADASERRAAGL